MVLYPSMVLDKGAIGCLCLFGGKRIHGYIAAPLGDVNVKVVS